MGVAMRGDSADAASKAATAIDRGYVGDFCRDGFAVVRGVFGAGEVAELAAASERVYGAAMSHPKSFRHGNLFYRITDDPALGRVCRIAQWPSYDDETLARLRIDPRMLALLEPLIGNNLKQITNQLHWKPRGAEKVAFGYHQDVRFRRPRRAYRGPAGSFVQTLIAIDPHDAESGGMRFLPGSHKIGELDLGGTGPVMDRPLSEADLKTQGLDPAALVDLDLAPGDLALWSLFTVHGSGANRAGHDRRVYINGYVAARGLRPRRMGLPPRSTLRPGHAAAGALRGPPRPPRAPLRRRARNTPHRGLVTRRLPGATPAAFPSNRNFGPASRLIH